MNLTKKKNSFEFLIFETFSTPYQTVGHCSAIGTFGTQPALNLNFDMSDDAEDFESINLASVAIDTKPLSLLSVVPESSDDGLDPNDFLTQNQTEIPQASEYLDKNVTDGTVPGDDRSASQLTSNLYESTLRDSMSPSVFRADDLLSYDTESGWQTRQEFELLLRFLLDKLESLKKEMKWDMLLHKQFLSEGSDCKQIRETIGDRFLQMSENYYALNEIYNKESTMLRGFLQHLEKWDSKRSKILNRVKSIKSEGHNFGVKLADLLRKRNDIDDEIEDLENRLRILRENKVAVESEIDEASSVLESKSAKYVNLFRELEKQGEGVITGFLLSSGLPQNDLQVLLRRHPVEAAFKYKTPEPKLAPADATTFPPRLTKNSVPEIKKPEPQSQPQSNVIGAQAFEVNEEELPNFAEKTAYEEGYEKGNEQLAKFKERVSTIIEAIIRPQEQPRSQQKNVDDRLNTITEMIDLIPIVELLSHRIGAFEDLRVVSSKLSAQLHHDGESWRSIALTLSGKEEKLLEILSHSTPLAKEVKETLISSFEAMKRLHEEQTRTQTTDGLHRYLSILVHRELKAIASTLESMGDTNYLSRVSSLESSIDEDMLSLETPTRPLRKFKMTNQGYKPAAVTIADTIKENVDSQNLLRNKYLYEKSIKDLKNE